MRRLILGLMIAGFALLTPSWLLAGDQEVAAQIAANLKTSGKMHGYSIGVKVQEGTVWLNGTVKSQEQLTTALDIVQDTPGIEKIVNGLSVTGGGQGTIRQTAAEAADYEAPSPAAPSANRSATPMPIAMGGTPRLAAHPASMQQVPVQMTSSSPNGSPIPAYTPAMGGGVAPAHFDHPQMPGYAWPSYASAPNYAALTYPKQYSPTAWPFIGPFYPYPQVPLGWRKVTLEWHNGWWMLDFNDGCTSKY